jgi:hypothetical protein
MRSFLLTKVTNLIIIYLIIRTISDLNKCLVFGNYFYVRKDNKKVIKEYTYLADSS